MPQEQLELSAKGVHILYVCPIWSHSINHLHVSQTAPSEYGAGGLVSTDYRSYAMVHALLAWDAPKIIFGINSLWELILMLISYRISDRERGRPAERGADGVRVRQADQGAAAAQRPARRNHHQEDPLRTGGMIMLVDPLFYTWRYSPKIAHKQGQYSQIFLLAGYALPVPPCPALIRPA